MKTLEISDRIIAHKFNYECDAEYVEMTAKQELDAKQNFLDLFVQKEEMVQTVLDILKSCLTGETLRYIFFHTGTERNGKSLLFELLESIFQKTMDGISKEVILVTKKSGSITSEFEILDKARIGQVSELKQSDELKISPRSKPSRVGTKSIIVGCLKPMTPCCTYLQYACTDQSTS